MKKSMFGLALCIFCCYCTSTKKLANEAFDHALLGQNEKTVCSRIGTPTSIAKTIKGGKILMYEFYSFERTPTVKNFEPADYDRGISFTSKSGAIYEIPFDPKQKKLQNTTVQKKMTSLRVFLDKQGKCIRYDHNLPKERLEFYYQRLRTYVPNDAMP